MKAKKVTEQELRSEARAVLREELKHGLSPAMSSRAQIALEVLRLPPSNDDRQ